MSQLPYPFTEARVSYFLHIGRKDLATNAREINAELATQGVHPPENVARKPTHEAYKTPHDTEI